MEKKNASSFASSISHIMLACTVSAPCALLCNEANAKPGASGRIRTIRLNERGLAHVWVSPNGTIINFPIRPTKVIVGRQKAFDIEYIENDVAIAPLFLGATSNVFVYVLGKRYGLLIEAVPSGGDDVVIVRDVEGASDPVDRK